MSTYTVSPFPQRSPEWRKIIVVSSTDIGPLMGHNEYVSRERVYEKFRSLERPAIPETEDMKRGVRCEPEARRRLEQCLRQHWDVRIVELGLATLNSQPLFGTSVDGLVVHSSGEPTPWCVEIKCPRYLYDDLFDIQPTPDYRHIKRDHYDQMQWHCYILNKEGCFYAVYVEDTQEFFFQYVPRNTEYIKTLVDTATAFLRDIGRI